MISSRALEPATSGTVGEFADRLNEGIPIEASLPASEILCRPSENICEIELSGDTKTDAPFWLGHQALYSAVPEITFSERPFK